MNCELMEAPRAIEREKAINFEILVEALANALVTASLRDGGSVTGRVVEADDARVVLDVDGAPLELALAEVAKGAVQVEFSRQEEDA